MWDVFPERDMILQRRATPWTEYLRRACAPRSLHSDTVAVPLSPLSSSLPPHPISKSNEKTYPFPPYTASRTH